MWNTEHILANLVRGVFVMIHKGSRYDYGSHMPVMSFVQAAVSHSGAQTDGNAEGPSS